MIKRLTIAVIAAAGLYSGYWFVGASTVETGATTALDDMRADGWDIAYDDLSTSGFPNRFDTTLTAPRLSAPGGYPAWQAEGITVYALSYRPNEVIALFPPVQTVALGTETLTLSAAEMRASAKVSASLALPLDNLTLQTGPLSASSDAGWEMVVDSALAAFRVSGPAENAYDLYITLAAPALDGAAASGLALDDITIDAQAIFDAPLDRHSTSPALLEVTLREARVALDAANITARGALTFDAAGKGNGEIAVTATDWAAMIDTFETAGALTAPQAETLRNAARSLSGGEADFSAPIVVTDGIARFGFFPLGTVAIAPRG